MKKIKRTTIKITRRESIIARGGEEIGIGTVQKCPTCHLPLPTRMDFPVEEKLCGKS